MAVFPMSELSEKRPLTSAEREARAVFRRAEAEKAISDHDKQQKAFHANRERLESERLAREASEEASEVSAGI